MVEASTFRVILAPAKEMFPVVDPSPPAAVMFAKVTFEVKDPSRWSPPSLTLVLPVKVLSPDKVKVLLPDLLMATVATAATLSPMAPVISISPLPPMLSSRLAVADVRASLNVVEFRVRSPVPELTMLPAVVPVSLSPRRN